MDENKTQQRKGCNSAFKTKQKKIRINKYCTSFLFFYFRKKKNVYIYFGKTSNLGDWSDWFRHAIYDREMEYIR